MQMIMKKKQVIDNKIYELKELYPCCNFFYKNNKIKLYCKLHNHSQSYFKPGKLFCPFCNCLNDDEINLEIKKIKMLMAHEFDEYDEEFLEYVIETIMYITNNIFSKIKIDTTYYGIEKIKVKRNEYSTPH